MYYKITLTTVTGVAVTVGTSLKVSEGPLPVSVSELRVSQAKDLHIQTKNC